jgi:hypothetical protein
LKDSPKTYFFKTNIPKVEVGCGEPKRRRRKLEWELNRVFQEHWVARIG